MRGTKVKRLRKLGLKPGPVERAPLTAGEAAPIAMRMEAAKAPYANRKWAQKAARVIKKDYTP